MLNTPAQIFDVHLSDCETLSLHVANELAKPVGAM